MWAVSLLLLFSSLLGASAQQNITFPTNVTAATVMQTFQNASIVPSVIPTFNVSSLLDLVFNSTTTPDLAIVPGQNVSIEQATVPQPLFFLATNETALLNETFVLVIVDPDALTPQQPNLSDFRHFLGLDFRLARGASGNHSQLTNTTPALTEFLAPAPPPGSDPHRYVTLLYLQPANFTTVAPTLINASTPRNNTNLTAFVAATHLGSPVAGTFYLAQNTSGTNGSNSSSPPGPGGASTGTGAGVRLPSGAVSAVGVSVGAMLLAVLL
ncbi:phosphatidylethanolamine-binding protein [Gloeopeniophorella convolvens]|nr:phosphatidylethanolamine-binding protein [Gloeopeniophorella convolvens]